MRVLLAILLVFLGFGEVYAQGLTIRASSGRWEGHAAGRGFFLAPGTDITQGHSAYGQGPFGSSGSVSYAPSVGEQWSAEFKVGAAGVNRWWGYETAAAAGSVEIVLSSPSTRRFILLVAICGSSRFYAPIENFSITVPGYNNWPFENPAQPCETPRLRTFPLVVGPGGVSIIATGRFAASPDSYVSATARFTLVMDPSEPCTVAPYGTTCGATLTADGDVRVADRKRFRILDVPQQYRAWFIAGTQRVSLPLPPCLIFNEGLVVLPMSIDANHIATYWFAPPSIPGFYFYAQGLLESGSRFSLTQGLEVRCP